MDGQMLPPRDSFIKHDAIPGYSLSLSEENLTAGSTHHSEPTPSTSRRWPMAAWLICCLCFLLLASRAQASISISSLSPTSGAVGAFVTISGSFGRTQGTVTFNGVTASITSWSAKTVVATVPNGASTGNVVATVAGVSSNGVAF